MSGLFARYNPFQEAAGPAALIVRSLLLLAATALLGTALRHFLLAAFSCEDGCSTGKLRYIRGLGMGITVALFVVAARWWIRRPLTRYMDDRGSAKY